MLRIVEWVLDVGCCGSVVRVGRPVNGKLMVWFPLSPLKNWWNCVCDPVHVCVQQVTTDFPLKCHHDEATTGCTALVAVIKRLPMARLFNFFLSHFHIKPFILYFGDITNYRWHRINSARNCFLRLSRSCNSTADFPFWISESRTSILEPVKLFFLRLDAIESTLNTSWHRRGEVKPYMVLFWAWSMQIYYLCALKYARVAFIIYAGRLPTFSEVESIYWIWRGVFVRDLLTKKLREI